MLPELLVILVIVLIIFGLGKLPEALGKGVKSFKEAMRESKEIDITPRNDQDKTKTR